MNKKILIKWLLINFVLLTISAILIPIFIQDKSIQQVTSFFSGILIGVFSAVNYINEY